MALARITTQFPEYSVALARSLRSQGFEVHTCAPGETTSKPADLEITLKPCAQEDRQTAIDQQATDKDMYVVVSPGIDASQVRSIEMVVLRPRAELEMARETVTPAQVIVMSLALFRGKGFNPRPLTGRWRAAQAKAAATWELACALCWHVSKTAKKQFQKVRAGLKNHRPQTRKEVPVKVESGIDPELVPSMFGLSSEALGVGTSDFVQVEFAPQRSWREPLVNFAVKRWGIVASAIVIGLLSVVLPQLWHSNAVSQAASAAHQSEPVPSVASAAPIARPVPALAKTPANSTRKAKAVAKSETDEDIEASFGNDVTVRRFPPAGARGAAHTAQTVARRVVLN